MNSPLFLELLRQSRYASYTGMITRRRRSSLLATALASRMKARLSSPRAPRDTRLPLRYVGVLPFRQTRSGLSSVILLTVMVASPRGAERHRPSGSGQHELLSASLVTWRDASTATSQQEHDNIDDTVGVILLPSRRLFSPKALSRRNRLQATPRTHFAAIWALFH